MRLRTWTTRTALAVCTLFLGAAIAQTIVPTARITAPINNSTRVAVSNSTPGIVSRSVDGGRMAPNTKLGRMVLMLTPTAEQDKAAAALVSAQHDPKSKLYHKWLTPEEFGQRFGIADSDAAQVKAWLESNGLTVHEVAKSRRFVTFSGTVAGVERAFSTQMHTYNLKGKTFISNSQDIKIPAALKPVVKSVARLHSLPKLASAKIQGKATMNSITGQLSFSDGAHAMGPADFAKIYNVKPLWDAGIDGTGQKIAIVGRTSFNPADISDFRSFFGLSNANPPQIIVNGDDPGVTGDEVEALLDVTWAGAVAPGAQIIYVESASNFDDGVDVSAAYIVDHNLAPVMSTSYGACEYDLDYANYFFGSLWQQAAAQGITAFVSSGDNGAMGCSSPGAGNAGSFEYPGSDVNGLASTPYNVAVGGTQFDDTADPSQYWNPVNTTGFLSVKGYIPEIVWNESSNDPNNFNLYASSGGASTYWDKPDWQTAPGVDDWLNFFAGDTFFGYYYDSWFGWGFVPRLVPDVSLAAAGHDGYLICVERSCASGYLYYVGGTSAASPSWAGIMALINQKTGVPQGNANPMLYKMFTDEGENHTIFHDIVKGDNYVPGDAYPASYWSPSSGSGMGETGDKIFGYSAEPGVNVESAGYDVATGLGSVDVYNLVNAWTGIGNASSTTAITGPEEEGPFTHGDSLTFNISVANTSSEGGSVPTGVVALFATQVQEVPNSIVRAAINASTTTLSLGNGTVDEAGETKIQTYKLQGGTWNVWARYQGDNNIGSSVSDNVTVTIGKEDSTTEFGAIVGGYIVTGSTPVELHYGEPIPVVALVYGGNGIGYPSGTVDIQANGSTVASSTLQYGESYYTTGSNQSSTIFNLYSRLPVSETPYILQAVYGGDNSFNGSSSNLYPVQVLKGNTYTNFAVSGTVVPGVSAPLSGYVALDYANAAALPLSGTVTIDDLSTGSPVGTATVNPDGSFSTNVQFAAAGTHRLQATFSGDANTNGSVYLRSYAVVAKANTTTTLTPGTTTANYGASVTLTAQVASGVAGHIPTGTVSFSDASGTVGSGTLDSTGKYVLTTTGLTGGVHNITAAYSGDTVSATSTSSSVTVTVRDYKVQVLPATLSITSGQTGTATFNIIPVGGFNSAVSFACTGLPANATCSFNKSSVTPNGTDPEEVTLTVSTKANAVASLSPLHNRWMAASGITFAGVLMVLPFGSRRRRRMVLPLMLLTLALVLCAVGCGGSSSTPSNQVQPGTYSVVVGGSTTGTGAISHTATFSLVVTK